MSDITTDDWFENLTLLLREEGSETRQVMEDYLFRNQINFSKKLQLTSNEAVKQAIITRLGSSILPLISLKNELLNNNLQIIPAKNSPIKTIWSLIGLKNNKHSPVAKAYLNFLEPHKENSIEEIFGWYSNY